MKEKYKTKKQLINELGELHQRIAELEKSEKEHIRMEELLQESEEKMETIIENVNDIIFQLSTSGLISYVSPNVKELYGYKPEELVGKHLTRTTPMSELPKAIKALKTVLSGKTIKYFEINQLDSKGKIIPTEINITPVKKKAKIIAVQGVMRDTRERKKAEEAFQKAYSELERRVEERTAELFATNKKMKEEIQERKRAEEALHVKKAYLGQLFESAPEAIVMNTNDGRILSVNNEFVRIFRYTREEAIGQSLDKLVAPKELFEEAVSLTKRVEKGERVSVETVRRRNDGTLIYVSILGAPIIIDDKQVAVYSIYRDITEHKEAEEEKERLQAQLVQSEKMAGIGTLASGIAHEFNNLLQIMSGHSEFARRTKKAEDMEEALDIVMRTSERVSKIIRDLATFSRKEGGEKELCSIRESLESVLSLTGDQLKKNNIKIVREYGRTSKVKINKGEIQQVFLNMITNARDTMLPKGGKLEVRLRQIKDHIEVSFTDTGKGIKRENLEKVFEPFYTTKGAVGGSTTIAGTGLGLSVSYGIVQRHGGTIEVESKVGKETTFTVKLPVKRVRRKRIDRDQKYK